MTIHLDGTDGRTAVLPGSYLDGRRREERNRRVDLAYATTGHRAQGLTRGRALVRLTGTEDVNWLYVQLSRARQDTRLYAVVGPEPQGAGELDLPDREQPDAYLQLAQALSRAGGQTLAIDTPAARIPSGCPRPSCGPSGTGSAFSLTRPLATAAASWPGPRPTASRPRKPWPPTTSPPAARRPGCFAGCAATPSSLPGCRVGWRWPPSSPIGLTTGSGSCASTSSAATAGSTRGRRAWQQAAAEIEHYRHTYGISDPVRALGPEPADRAQRADRQRARTAIERVQAKQRAADRTHQRQPASERPTQPRPYEQRGRRGPERAAG